MDIALQTNMIVIRTSRKRLDKAWINNFLAKHKEELLFLSHSVIIYHNDKQEEEKKAFLSKACELFAEKESLDATFFVRAIMCCLHYPIKIQTIDKVEEQPSLDVEVTALDTNHISMKLKTPDIWFQIYMQSKLDVCLLKASKNELLFDLYEDEFKAIFERSLNRNHIFSRKIHYHYAKEFLQTLFSVNHYTLDDSSLKYYAILQCEENASKDELKNSYKQLAKTYHPDQIIHLNDKGKIGHYTRMFQQVQEAYQALKGA